MNDPDSDIRPSPSACDEFRERIANWIDSPDSETDAWRRHARACPACAVFEANLRSVETDFGLMRGTPVRDLWPQIEMKLAATPVRAGPVRKFGMRAVAAAAAALAVWSTLAYFSQHGDSNTLEEDGLARAVGMLSTLSATPNELAQRDSIPEVRLLARISDRNGEQR